MVALLAASAGRRRPVHFLDALTVGGALTASEVAVVVACLLYTSDAADE